MLHNEEIQTQSSPASTQCSTLLGKEETNRHKVPINTTLTAETQIYVFTRGTRKLCFSTWNVSQVHNRTVESCCLTKKHCDYKELHDALHDTLCL